MERGKGLFFFYSSLLFSVLAFFFPYKSQIKMKNKKQKKLFPHNGVRSWLAYPKSLCFQVFLLFLICRDRTRCTTKSICSREDKTKNFPLLFLIRRNRTRCTKKSIRSQGRKYSETKTKKISNNKTDKI